MKLALILALALLGPAVRAQSPAKRKKKAPVAKKKKSESRFKSTALSRSVVEHYLFDEDGNPIDKKKPAAPAKKKAPPSAEPDDDGSGLATSSDADAL